MIKISKKARTIFDKAHDTGLFTEENFMDDSIHEAWEELHLKMFGQAMYEDRERCGDVLYDLAGRKNITMFYNGDEQWFLWFCDEKTLISRMTKWVLKLQKLYDKQWAIR